ncbi:DUF2188 domain-containing protein [Chloroflexota bacterium]
MPDGRREARTSRRVHVIARDKGWAIKKEGLSKASRIHQNKEAAVNSARTLRTRGHDVIIHRKDGSIERWEKARR